MKKYWKLGAATAGLIAAAFALLVIVGPLGAGAGHTLRTKLEVRLDATDIDPLASGKSKWEQRFEEDGVTLERQRTSTEVEDLSAEGAYEIIVSRDTTEPPDGTFDTVISSGEMFVDVDALGFGDLNLDSRDGDSVPDMQDGDLIEVFTPGGELVLSGVLQVKD